MIFLLYVAAAALAASLFFALLSNVLGRYSVARLEEAFEEKGRRADLDRFHANEESLILGAASWRMVANVAFIVLVTVYLADRAGIAAWILGGLLAGLALLVLGVAVPMAWARYNAERVLVRTLPVLFLLRALGWPVVALLRLCDWPVRRLSGVPDQEDREEELESELLSMVKEGEIEGAFEEEEKEMIESIIELKDADVARIMTPRTDMACLEENTPLHAAREFAVAQGHSRIPVYRENLDTIVGVVYAKDLLGASGEPGFEEKAVSEVHRNAVFIPETKKLTELLHEFQTQGVHIAIVLDEYGGTAGLVTIEDVIEEIVGEITDEYDATEPEGIRRISDTAAEVDARTPVNEVNDKLKIELPEEEDYDTAGGFVCSKLGYIPKPGESFSYQGLTITILEADLRRVARIRIEGSDQHVRSQK